MNKLFVYGIFLDIHSRLAFGMSDAKYDTVANYSTVGVGGIPSNTIVEAIPDEGKTLTGLLVDVAPYVNLGENTRDNWKELDSLEAGYDRIQITTNSGVDAWIYVRSERWKY